jgi:hypothetical protein
MAWMFLLWAKLMVGICVPQETMQLSNPLEGYSFQEKHTSQTTTAVNYNPEDSEEDSEDSDDETDTAFVNRENQVSMLPIFSQTMEHIYVYHDRLSQAHLSPIVTPPDTHMKI